MASKKEFRDSVMVSRKKFRQLRVVTENDSLHR